MDFADVTTTVSIDAGFHGHRRRSKTGEVFFLKWNFRRASCRGSTVYSTSGYPRRTRWNGREYTYAKCAVEDRLFPRTSDRDTWFTARGDDEDPSRGQKRRDHGLECVKDTAYNPSCG